MLNQVWEANDSLLEQIFRSITLNTKSRAIQFQKKKNEIYKSEDENEIRIQNHEATTMKEGERVYKGRT